MNGIRKDPVPIVQEEDNGKDDKSEQAELNACTDLSLR